MQAGGRSIGVFRIGDKFYAVNNYCPHQGGPLCLGRTKPWVTSDGPGEYGMADEEALVACPWHGWEYDLATGQSFLGPGEPPARTYEVSVEYDAAPGEPGTEPDPGSGTAPEAKAGRQPGPYVVDTFPVHVENAYVVVETNARPARAGRRTGGGQ